MDENKVEVGQGERKVIKLSRKKTLLYLVMFIIIFVLVLVPLLLLPRSSWNSPSFIEKWISLVCLISIVVIPVFLFIWGLTQYLSTSDLVVKNKARGKIIDAVVWIIIAVILFFLLPVGMRLVNLWII